MQNIVACMMENVQKPIRIGPTTSTSPLATLNMSQFYQPKTKIYNFN